MEDRFEVYDPSEGEVIQTVATLEVAEQEARQELQYRPEWTELEIYDRKISEIVERFLRPGPAEDELRREQEYMSWRGK